MTTGRDRTHALTDQHRGIRHHPHHREAGRQFRLDPRGGDTRGQRDQDLVAVAVEFEFAEFGQHRVHIVRFDGDHQYVGAIRRLGQTVGDPDAEALAQHLRAGRDRLDHDQLLGRPPGLEQSGDQRLADPSATDHRNSRHGAQGYPCRAAIRAAV